MMGITNFRSILLFRLSLVLTVGLLLGTFPQPAISADRPYTRQEIDSKFKDFDDQSRNQNKVLDQKIDLIKEPIHNIEKILDWWIGILTLVAGIAGVGLPYLITRNLRNEYEQALRKAQDAAKIATDHADAIKKYAKQAEEDSGEIARRRKVLSELEPGPEPEPVLKPTPEQSRAITETLRDPRSPDIDKLKALALAAQARAQWNDAATIWSTIHVLAPEDPDPLLRQAKALEASVRGALPEKTVPTLTKARELVEEALSIDHENPLFFVALGDIVGELARASSAKSEKKRLIEEAINYYQKASKLDPNLTSAYTNFGNRYSDLAGITSDVAEKKRLFQEAANKFRASIERRPTNAIAYSNLANAMAQLARLTDDPAERRSLLDQAVESYQKAITLRPDYSSPHVGLGNRKADLAKHATNPAEKRSLLREAIAHYNRAIEMDPKNAGAYYNWGGSLGALSTLSDHESEKASLLEEAIAKFSSAIELEPGVDRGYSGLGRVMFDLASTETQPERKERLLADAIANLRRALELNEVSSARQVLDKIAASQR
jgi:tetratricopeptide (TPR) repeat protein